MIPYIIKIKCNGFVNIVGKRSKRFAKLKKTLIKNCIDKKCLFGIIESRFKL